MAPAGSPVDCALTDHTLYREVQPVVRKVEVVVYPLRVSLQPEIFVRERPCTARVGQKQTARDLDRPRDSQRLYHTLLVGSRFGAVTEAELCNSRMQLVHVAAPYVVLEAFGFVFL